MAESLSGGNILGFCYEAQSEDAVLEVVMGGGADQADDDEGGGESLALLREKAVRLRAPDGRSVLHCAVERGWSRLVVALLGWGASPVEPGLGTSGNSPLHVAARLGHAAVLKALLASPLLREVDIVNANGDTALMFACAGGHLGCTSLLLAAGASMVRANSQGLLPLQLSLDSPPLLDLILRHLEAGTAEQRSNVLHARGLLGQQALHFAATYPGNVGAVERLLAAGADPFQRNAAGKLPVDVAGHSACADCVTVLRAAMAERERIADATAAALFPHHQPVDVTPPHARRKEKQSARSVPSAEVEEEDNRREAEGKAEDGVTDSREERGRLLETKGKGGHGVGRGEWEDEKVVGTEASAGGQSLNSGSHEDAEQMVAEREEKEDIEGLRTGSGEVRDAEWRVVTGSRRRRWVAENDCETQNVGAVGQAVDVAEALVEDSTPPLVSRQTWQHLNEAERRSSDCSGWSGLTLPSNHDEATVAKSLLQEKYPKAAALDIEALNVLGVGIEMMSVSQLEALEEIHLSQLAQLAEARVQIATRHKQQAHMEAVKLAQEFREALLHTVEGGEL